MPLSESTVRTRRGGGHIAVLCFIVAMALPLLLAVRQPTAAASSAAPAAAAVAVAPAPEPRVVAARSTAALAPRASRSTRPAPPDDEELAAAAAQELARAPEQGDLPRAPETSPLASLPDGPSLVVPATPDVEAIVGFHQAGRGNGAVALDPDHDTHEVMPSRGRGTESTTAVDVALPERTVVVSPVDGLVVTAAPYRLYGTTSDDMVVVEPDGHPDVAVHVLHLDGLHVQEGDRVVAGETPIGVVRTLPFGSQIDRLTGDARPHVHLEVRPRE